MGLNVKRFFSEKSVKLSDSFKVNVWYTDNSHEELFNCAGFTLPHLEFNEEVQSYGNISQVFLVPKYDNPLELTLELYEGYKWSKDKKFFFIVRDRFQPDTAHGLKVGKSFTINQQFTGAGYQSNEATYAEPFDSKHKRTNHDISKIEIEIMNNRLSKTVMTYRFTNLYVTNVKQYDLSYSDESLTKWEISFVCETYEKDFK